MILHLRNIETNEVVQKNCHYPRGIANIHESVIGLAPNLQFFYQEDVIPFHDARTHKLSEPTEEWADVPHPEYSHLKKMILSYEVVQLTNEEIAANLKSEYLTHKSQCYPEHDRMEDLGKAVWINNQKSEGVLLTELEQSHEAALLATRAWLVVIGTEYQTQKAALLNNGEIPSFIFTPRA